MELKYHPHNLHTELVKINNYSCQLFQSKDPAPYFVIWLKFPIIISETLLNKINIMRYKNDIEINKFQDRLIGFGDKTILGSEDEMIKRINEGFEPYEYYKSLYDSLSIITNNIMICGL